MMMLIVLLPLSSDVVSGERNGGRRFEVDEERSRSIDNILSIVSYFLVL